MNQINHARLSEGIGEVKIDLDETQQLSGSSNFLVKVDNIQRNIPVNPFGNPSFLLQATYVLYTCHFHEDQDPHSFYLFGGGGRRKGE